MGVVTLTVALIAGGVGSLLGSGVLSPESRFYAEQAAAQNGVGAPYGPPRVYGHPEGDTGTPSWAPILRRAMALDGLN